MNSPAGRPLQHHHAAGSPRVVSQFELFCDLIFAGAFAALAGHLQADMAWPRLGAFAGLFVPVFWLWVVYTFYADRFDADDTPQRVITLAGMLALCALAVSAERTPGTGDTLFVSSYLAARAIPAVLYWRTARHNPRARAIARNYTTGSLLSAAVWIVATTALPAPARYWGWALAVTIEWAIPLAGHRTVARTTRSVDHLTERYAQLSIIVIGVAVVGVISGFGNQPWTAARVAVATACFTIAAALWWTYFNRGDHQPIGRQYWRLQAFSLGHLPATAALAAIGPGAAALIHFADNRHPCAVAVACLGGGAALYLAATAAVRSIFTSLHEPIVLGRLLTAAVIIVTSLASRPLGPTAFAILVAAALIGEVGHKIRQLPNHDHPQPTAPDAPP